MSTPASVLDELGLSDGRSRTPPGALDLGGTIRTRTAGETLQAIRPLFPRLGITRLADVTGMDSIGVPVAMCIRPNARHLSVSQGKGVSSELAMVSAAMESVEMYHAEHLGPPDLTAAWEGLDRASVRPGDLELGIWHQAHRDREEIGWVEAAELLSGRPILVPHVLWDLDSSRTHPDTGLFAVSSNGLASGNCLLEAVLHGLYEVVERDADLRFSNLDPDVHESRRLSLEHTGAAVIDDLVERLRDDPTVRLDAW
ncbi:MAG: YcaO-like family protein, partial [Acidimicrobiales bacterium]